MMKDISYIKYQYPKQFCHIHSLRIKDDKIQFALETSCGSLVWFEKYQMPTECENIIDKLDEIGEFR